MKKYATGLALSSLVLAIGITQTTFVYADDCSKPEYQALLKIKTPDVIHRINELNLTQAQKDQFKPMKNSFDAENKKFVASIKPIFVQMNQMVASPTIDQAHLDSLLLDLKKSGAESLSRTAIFRHNLYNLLNATQRTKYHELQQQERQVFRMGLECPAMAMKIRGNPNIANFDPFDHINELNLTKEQKSKIMPLITSNRDEAKKILTQFDDSAMSVNEMENQLVQSTSTIDSAKLNAFATAPGNSFGEIQKNRLMTYRGIYTVLNPQQQVKFMEMLKKQLPK